LQAPFERLILNGDTFHGMNFKKYMTRHWRVLGQLREIARKRELILLRGNHEGPSRTDEFAFGPLDVVSNLIGVEIQEEYHLTVAGKRYLLLHGDRFDPTVHWPVVSDAAEWCYRATKKIHKKSARWLKERVKKAGGVVEFVKRGAAEYARSRGCDGVITGHTHFCDNDMVDGIHYINTGCWVDSPCTYVTLKDDVMTLMSWDEATPRTPLAEIPLVPRATTVGAAGVL
jgi:UDP-2,3-diacylglucosamine pyrophosphatase LpxH